MTTGIENHVISRNSFNIYPSSHHINIEPLSDAWEGKTGTVNILDLHGRIVCTLPNTEFRKNLLIQINAPAIQGMYIVELRSGVMRYVGKVVIK
jgi:hypothetical protein